MSLLSIHVSEALNGTWRINVSGQVYGPYTGHQIKAFATEGRIAPHSIVQSGDGPWITAIDDPVLAQLFVQKGPKLSAATAQAAEPVSKPAAVQPLAAAESPYGNFVVVADLRSRSSIPFEGAIVKLGDCYRVNGLVWILNTDKTAGAIRNELVQHLGHSDHLVVFDATRDKMTWYGLGPEAESKMRKTWRRRDKA